MTPDVVLRATRLSVQFGSVHALTEVDLEIRHGQIVGLIGPNGAGKTTLIDALTGFVPARGEISLRGEDITSIAAHRRARAGLGRTWQAADLFDDLTVRENLEVGDDHRPAATVLLDAARRRHRRDRSDEALERVGLAGLGDVGPGSLTEGQRKLVGVARALAADPAVLLLDEPAAGLDSSESAELGRRIQEMAAGRTAVVLIDHDMDLVLNVCDLVVVLNFGTVIATGTPAAVRQDPAVRAAYLGTAAPPVPDELTQEPHRA